MTIIIMIIKIKDEAVAETTKEGMCVILERINSNGDCNSPPPGEARLEIVCWGVGNMGETWVTWETSTGPQ